MDIFICELATSINTISERDTFVSQEMQCIHTCMCVCVCVCVCVCDVCVLEIVCLCLRVCTCLTLLASLIPYVADNQSGKNNNTVI